MIERPNKLWLPRTGQTVSDVTGDDGYYQRGCPRATRFINNGNNTVTDLATGLIWIRDHDAMGSPWNATMTYADLQTYLATLNGAGYAGRSDWCVPNVREIHSLCVFDRYGPCMNASDFPNVKDSRYWSCTNGYVVSPPSANIYAVNVHTGTIELQGKTSSYYCRLVRGGQRNANR